jgi:hypothetical protein
VLQAIHPYVKGIDAAVHKEAVALSRRKAPQNSFVYSVAVPVGARLPKGSKSFLVLFFKKEPLPWLLP